MKKLVRSFLIKLLLVLFSANLCMPVMIYAMGKIPSEREKKSNGLSEILKNLHDIIGRFNEKSPLSLRVWLEIAGILIGLYVLYKKPSNKQEKNNEYLNGLRKKAKDLRVLLNSLCKKEDEKLVDAFGQMNEENIINEMAADIDGLDKEIKALRTTKSDLESQNNELEKDNKEKMEGLQGYWTQVQKLLIEIANVKDNNVELNNANSRITEGLIFS